MRPLPNKVANPHNLQRFTLLTMLRLGLSHLSDYQFKDKFLDTTNPLCSGDSDVETTSIFFLYSPLVDVLLFLFGDNLFNQFDNNRVFNTIIAFTFLSKRFDDPLFYIGYVMRNWTRRKNF